MKEGDAMAGIVPEKQLYCLLDSKPINKSKVYPLIKLFLGENVAQKLTYKGW